jgi:hypothetical protein
VPKKRRFTTQQLEAFKKEMRIWSRLYHPNICLFMGAYVHPDKVLIVTEILEGDLESLLKKNKKLSLYTRMKMAKVSGSAGIVANARSFFVCCRRRLRALRGCTARTQK